MKKLYLLFLLITITFTEARMLDGIAIIVENEPITLAEIRAVRSQMGISKAKAIDLLIQDRLQKTAMKDIVVPEDEVDSKIKEIAKQNNLSIKKMQKILKRQGTSWVQYRADIRESLKKAHFYQDVVVASTPEPTEDELKLFYNKNKSKFTIPRTISVTEYSSKTEKTLQNLRTKHRYTKAIHSKKIAQDTKTLSPEMLSLFLQTPKNGYTKIMNAGDKYITYKVRATHGKRIMPFEAAKLAVAASWKQAQQGQALKDYFKKLRTRADIQILRK